MTVGALILAGGRARRMGGVNKALLELDGMSYIQRIAGAFAGFEERLISVAPGSELHLDGFRNITDIHPDSGPMGGLYSALCAAESQALLVVPCDTPMFSRQLAEYLLQQVREADDMLVIEDGGRLQPLIGVYSRRCVPVMERCIADGQLRMRSLADRLNMRTLPLPAHVDKFTLMNINTAEDAQRAASNSGA